MNKRHYEHTLPNIRGSLSNTYEWWNSLDANQMEQITGCRQDKCPAGDNHQGFAETCNEWWENKGYDEKRKIWKEHNDC